MLKRLYLVLAVAWALLLTYLIQHNISNGETPAAMVYVIAYGPLVALAPLKSLVRFIVTGHFMEPRVRVYRD